MEPSFEPRKRLARPVGGVIIGTGLLLILAFFVLIVLFFVISAFTPSVVGQCVAVVEINQELSVEGAAPSVFSNGIPSSEDIATTIGSINGRDDIGAVVIVMNSGGGSVVATTEIYDAVKELDKPSVAYFREVAASGAYYVATGTDYIISDPNAITGSIGVITTFAEMSGLFEKVGINITTVKSGEFKDIGSPNREVTDAELEILQGINEEVYNEFKSIVLENRGSKLDMSKFANATDGRIMTGRQAISYGLVDELGNKQDAIMKAAELAGMEPQSIDDVRICAIPTTGTETSMFSLESLIRGIQMQGENPSISYK
jgi:protease-4